VKVGPGEYSPVGVTVGVSVSVGVLVRVGIRLAVAVRTGSVGTPGGGEVASPTMITCRNDPHAARIRLAAMQPSSPRI
jgi:hypothetical protein